MNEETNNAGFSESEALAWRNAGFTVKQALVFREAKITVDQAIAIREHQIRLDTNKTMLSTFNRMMHKTKNILITYHKAVKIAIATIIIIIFIAIRLEDIPDNVVGRWDGEVGPNICTLRITGENTLTGSVSGWWGEMPIQGSVGRPWKEIPVTGSVQANHIDLRLYNGWATLTGTLEGDEITGTYHWSLFGEPVSLKKD